MMPLWTTAMRPEQSMCGCELISDGSPCVAQRVWPMPGVPVDGLAPGKVLKVRQLADALAGSPARRCAGTAMPAES